MTPEAGVWQHGGGFSPEIKVTPKDIDIKLIVKKNTKGVHPFAGELDLVRLDSSGNHPYVKLGEPANTAKLYADGDKGLVVRTQAEDGTHVALCVVTYDEYPVGMRDDDFRIYPRILQMQGCTMPGDNRRRRGIVMSALSSFSLEGVCVDLVIATAQNLGQPAVGILPAEFNNNSIHPGFDMKRVMRRYDQTAIRRGFTRNPRGLFVKELTPNL